MYTVQFVFICLPRSSIGLHCTVVWCWAQRLGRSMIFLSAGVIFSSMPAACSDSDGGHSVGTSGECHTVAVRALVASSCVVFQSAQSGARFYSASAFGPLGLLQLRSGLTHSGSAVLHLHAWLVCGKRDWHYLRLRPQCALLLHHIGALLLLCMVHY